MAKRCVYCSTDIATDSVVDICRRCMHQVWGEKMSEAIIQGMTNEKEKGNLELGAVGSSAGETITDAASSLEEAKAESSWK